MFDYRRTALYLLLLFTLGCVKYSFKGALPSDLKTIAIPLFEDRSGWPGLQEDLTTRVVDSFIKDNTLRVVNREEDADLILRGVISSVDQRAVSIGGDETVKETQIWVNVQVKCLNTHTNKPLWSGTVRHFGTVSGSGTLEEMDQAIKEALDRIVEEILLNTTAAW
ncbi:MAG: hypothetical protein D6715_02635 [Calditrichaeota bacterium]|nr:MAG: hypothetical protein D6715_02635 [Calditrichota bacterium]